MFCIYTVAAKKWKMDIARMDILFFETDHTQNEGDSMHACRDIEAASREIFSEEGKEIIRSAKRETEAYVIFALRNADVLDFYQLVQHQNW